MLQGSEQISTSYVSLGACAPFQTSRQAGKHDTSLDAPREVPEMNLKRYTEGGETARRQCFFCAPFQESFSGFLSTRPRRGMATFLHPSTREIYRPASRRFHPPLSRTRKLYQNHRARIKRGGLQIHKLHFIAICYVCVEWIDSDFSML